MNIMSYEEAIQSMPEAVEQLNETAKSLKEQAKALAKLADRIRGQHMATVRPAVSCLNCENLEAGRETIIPACLKCSKPFLSNWQEREEAKL